MEPARKSIVNPQKIVTSQQRLEGTDCRPTPGDRPAEEPTAGQLQLLASAIHNCEDAILITTGSLKFPGPKIVFVNRTFTKMTGYAVEEILGKTPRIFQGPKTDRGVLNRLKRDLIAGRVFRGTTVNYRKDGSEFFNEWHVEPLRNSQGQITHYLSIQRDFNERRRREARLLYEITHDRLTNLYNRASFIDQLDEAVKRTKHRQNYSFAVLFLDLDRFKVVNDSLGHQVGDRLLAAIARRLRECVPPWDTVARLGGDEFAILIDHIRCPTQTPGRCPAQILQIAETIQRNLERPVVLGDREIFTTVSIGIASSHIGNYNGGKEILRDADTALYRAKANGKACHVTFHPTMHHRVRERLRLENDLRRAVERRELLLHYQPIVCLETGQIVGCEALVRWRHPRRGLVSPAQFIPIAEETGQIRAIGEWVLREACTAIRKWQSMFPLGKPPFVSVNLSSHQLSRSDFVRTVESILRLTECDPEILKLELTESAIAEYAETVIPKMKELDRLGIQLCIDDFGTGYSSLSRLYNFPIQTLKIDRSFIRGMGEAEDKFKIARAIVNLAHTLGMEAIAEGVETAEQLAILQDWGCQFGQGYLFSKPMEAGEIERLLSGDAIASENTATFPRKTKNGNLARYKVNAEFRQAGHD